MIVTTYSDEYAGNTSQFFTDAGGNCTLTPAPTPLHSPLPGPPLVVSIAALAVACVTCNSLLLVTLALSPRLHTVTYALLANLATTDLLVGAVALPAWAALSMPATPAPPGGVCSALAALTLLLFLESVATLGGVALDRYACICRPLRYPREVTRGRVAGFLVYTWVQSVALAAAPLLGWGRYVYRPGGGLRACGADWAASRGLAAVVLAAVLVPAALIAVCYLHVLRAARRQASRVHPTPADFDRVGRVVLPLGLARSVSQGALAGGGGWRTVTLDTDQLWRRAARAVKRSVRQHRALRTVLTVVTCFTVCWAPYIVLLVLHLASDVTLPARAEFAITFLAAANSLANPVLCAVVNKEFRAALPRAFGLHRRRLAAEAVAAFRASIAAPLPSTLPPRRRRTSSSSDVTSYLSASELPAVQRLYQMYLDTYRPRANSLGNGSTTGGTWAHVRTARARSDAGQIGLPPSMTSSSPSRGRNIWRRAFNGALSAGRDAQVT